MGQRKDAGCGFDGCKRQPLDNLRDWYYNKNTVNKQERTMTRQATDRILTMVEEGLLDRDTVILACLKYMSEDEVADMAHTNEFFYEEEEAE